MLDTFISHAYLALWCVSSSKHQIKITVEVQIPIRGVSLDTATKPIEHNSHDDSDAINLHIILSFSTYLQNTLPLSYFTALIQISVCGSSSMLILGAVGFHVSITDTVPLAYLIHPNTSACSCNSKKYTHRSDCDKTFS